MVWDVRQARDGRMALREAIAGDVTRQEANWGWEWREVGFRCRYRSTPVAGLRHWRSTPAPVPFARHFAPDAARHIRRAMSSPTRFAPRCHSDGRAATLSPDQ